MTTAPEVIIDNLKWCFLSFRGVLGRQAFLLALIVFTLANWLLAHWLALILGTDGPIYYNDLGQRDTARALMQLDETIAALLLLWPNLAVTVKRWRDVGLSVRYFIAAQIAIIVIVLTVPPLGMFLTVALALALFFAPTGSALPRSAD